MSNNVSFNAHYDDDCEIEVCKSSVPDSDTIVLALDEVTTLFMSEVFAGLVSESLIAHVKDTKILDRVRGLLDNMIDGPSYTTCDDCSNRFVDGRDESVENYDDGFRCDACATIHDSWERG